MLLVKCLCFLFEPARNTEISLYPNLISTKNSNKIIQQLKKVILLCSLSKTTFPADPDFFLSFSREPWKIGLVSFAQEISVEKSSLNQRFEPQKQSNEQSNLTQRNPEKQLLYWSPRTRQQQSKKHFNQKSFSLFL